MAEAGAETTFEIDERIYPLEAVQSAAYAFTDRAFVRVEPSGSGMLKVTMTPRPEASATARGEFDNELIHQALRLRVSESNRKIREFIVTKALVSAQPAVVAAAAVETCVECASGGAPAAPETAPIDEALEKEIDRLLAEIESGDASADPLGVSVPWEEKFGGKAGADGEKKPAAAKPAKAPKAKAPGKAKGR